MDRTHSRAYPRASLPGNLDVSNNRRKSAPLPSTPNQITNQNIGHQNAIKQNIQSIPNNNNDSPNSQVLDAWQHPALSVVARTIQRSDFSELSLRVLFINIGLFIAVIWVRRNVPPQYINPSLATAGRYTGMVYAFGMYMLNLGNILQLVAVINVVDAIVRFFRPSKVTYDHPLTPNQRKLMGLDTVEGAYITPPRAHRSSPSSRPSPRLVPHTRQATPERERERSGSPASVKSLSARPSPKPSRHLSFSMLSDTPSRRASFDALIDH